MYSDMSFMYKNVREIKTYNGFKFIEKKVRKNSCMYRVVLTTVEMVTAFMLIFIDKLSLI